MARVSVYPPGTVTAERGAADLNPWIPSTPTALAAFDIGPGTHRVQPSMVPGPVRDRHPGVNFNGSDLVVWST